MTEDWYADDKATLGDRIAAARDRAGLASRELAERLGVRHKTLKLWEEDGREPRANQLRMLSGLLGVSLVWLMTGRGAGPDAAPVTDSAAMSRTELRDLRVVLEDAVARIARLEKGLSDA